MKFLLVDSNTASNIGNAFFYEGIRYVLEQLLPSATVVGGAFPPFNSYRLNTNQIGNYFNYVDHVGDVDALVLAGPILDARFEQFFGAALRRARRENKLILLLSAGARKYDGAEFDCCSRLLNEIRPDIFISRDHDTFNRYAQFASNAYEGLCFAFYVAEYFQGYATPTLQPYITSTFDFGVEPDLRNLRADDLHRQMPALGEKHASPTRSLASNLSFLANRRLPDSVDGVKIIRPAHKPLRSKHLIFFKANTFVAFGHEPYLNLYRNTKLTLTDRLHAAVVTLAFGNSSRLYLASARTKLLKAVGCEAVAREVWRADLVALAELRRKQRNWLGQALESVGAVTHRDGSAA